MAAKWYELITGTSADKKTYKQYKARLAALPEPYRTAADGVDRYVMHAGGIAQSDVMLTMLDDLAMLFEEHAALGTPVRDVVGDDPVQFVEDFLANYSDGSWVSKERQRLIEAIDRAEGLS